jgi:rod shape-determining protein MreD
MRARRLAVFSALLLTVLLVQVTVLPMVLGGGFVPDLVVVLVAIVALEVGTRSALWLAAAGGLLVDLLAVSIPLGASVIVYASIAYLLGLLRPYLSERADLTSALLVGAVSSVSIVLSAALLGLLSAQVTTTGALLASSTLLAGAVGVLVAPMLFALVRRALTAVSRDVDERVL